MNSGQTPSPRSILIRDLPRLVLACHHRFRFLLIGAWALFLTLTVSGKTVLSPEQIAATKEATVMVLIRDGKVPVGTAFCISESGLFATWTDPDYRSEPMEIMLDPGGKNQKRYPVKVVRELGKSRLAILKAELTEKVPALKFGDATRLDKNQQLFEFSYAFDARTESARQMMQDVKSYPSIKVYPCRVESLAHMADVFKEIRYVWGGPRSMNSGGPVLDEGGAVVGVMFSKGNDHFAIPIPSLEQAISTPIIVVDKPKVAFSRRFTPVEFVVTLEWLAPPRVEPAVSLEMSWDGVVRRVSAVKGRDGKHRLSIAPMPQQFGGVKTKPAEASVVQPEQGQGSVAYKVVVKAGGGQTLASEEGTLFMNQPETSAAVHPTPSDGVALSTNREFRLPSPVYDVVSAESGRVLVLHLKEIKKLAVFDLAELKLRGYINLAHESVRFAGGSRHILAAYPATDLLERFSVRTLETELTTNHPFGEIEKMVMGSTSPNLALVLAKNWQSGSDFVLFDTDHIKLLAKSSGPQKVIVRASADGRTYGSTSVEYGPSGFQVMTVKYNRLSNFHESSHSGMLVPNADGSRIFTSESGIYTPKHVRVQKGNGTNQMLPSSLPMFFFSVPPIRWRGDKGDTNRGVVSLYLSDAVEPFAHFPEPFEEMSGTNAVGESHYRHDLTQDKRYHLNSQLNLFVTIPQTDDRLVFRTVDIRKILNEKKVDYLYTTTVAPQAKVLKPYRYQLQAVSSAGSVTFRLLTGPAGLTISPDGLVKWIAPSKPTEEAVIVSMNDSSGKEEFHTFRIEVVP